MVVNGARLMTEISDDGRRDRFVCCFWFYFWFVSRFSFSRFLDANRYATSSSNSRWVKRGDEWKAHATVVKCVDVDAD